MEFLSWLEKQIFDDLIKGVKDALGKVWQYMTAPLREAVTALHNVAESIYNASVSIAGPLAPVLFIFVVGVTTMGIIWVLKRLYELL